MKYKTFAATLCALLAVGSVSATVPTGTVGTPPPPPPVFPASGSATAGSTGNVTYHGQPSQQDRLKACNSQADIQKLGGDARTAYVRNCLKK